MKNKIEIVPRIRINGVYYTLDEIPEEKAREIIRSRIDLALTGMNDEKKAAV